MLCPGCRGSNRLGILQKSGILDKGQQFSMRIGGLTRHLQVLLLVCLGSLVVSVKGEAADAAPAAPERLTADQLVARLVQKNEQRANALESYQSRRSYSLTYVGFPTNLHADMTVNMTYHAPATKQFTVVSESGNKWIINHIFERLLNSEREALDPENRAATALNSNNYNFTLLSDQPAADDCSYVLQVEPKIPNKFLYRGKIWVNAKDFAVCRIEAEPAKNPSFWIKKTDIQHDYLKIGDFWLPADNKSVSDLRLGGIATLTIKYEDYKILESHALNQMGDPPPAGTATHTN